MGGVAPRNVVVHGADGEDQIRTFINVNQTPGDRLKHSAAAVIQQNPRAPEEIEEAPHFGRQIAAVGIDRVQCNSVPEFAREHRLETATGEVIADQPIGQEREPDRPAGGRENRSSRTTHAGCETV